MDVSGIVILSSEEAALVAIHALPSVNVVIPSDWDRLDKARILFETRGWLSATEPALPGEPLITAEFGNEGLESLIIWRVLKSEDPSPYFNIGGLLARLTKSPRLEAGGWTLNCAGMEMHSQILTASGIEIDAPRLREHIMAAVTTRDEPPVMCGVNFLPRNPAEGLPHSLVQLGFQEIRGYQHAILELRGDSYHDYLANLTRHQRGKVRHDRRLFAQSDQQISISTGPAVTGEDLIQLHRANRRKYGGPDGEQELRMFHSAMARSAGEGILVIRTYRGEVCVGFAMFLRSGSTLHAMCVGFEKHGEKVGPYFECVYYAAIEWAYQNDIKEIDYGIGATMAKSERGCQIVDVSTWYLPSGSSLLGSTGGAEVPYRGSAP